MMSYPGEPGEKGWISVEDLVLDATLGEAGPIAMVFLDTEPRQISDTHCGEFQLTYFWDVYVYWKCSNPDFTLLNTVDIMNVGDENASTALLTCGGEGMANQQVNFSLDGLGHINGNSNIQTSADGSAEISLTADGPGILTVSAEYEACPSQEPPNEPLMIRVKDINVLGWCYHLKWTATVLNGGMFDSCIHNQHGTWVGI